MKAATATRKPRPPAAGDSRPPVPKEYDPIFDPEEGGGAGRIVTVSHTVTAKRAAAAIDKLIADMDKRGPVKPGQKTGPQLIRELRDRS